MVDKLPNKFPVESLRVEAVRYVSPCRSRVGHPLACMCTVQSNRCKSEQNTILASYFVDPDYSNKKWGIIFGPPIKGAPVCFVVERSCLNQLERSCLNGLCGGARNVRPCLNRTHKEYN